MYILQCAPILGTVQCAQVLREIYMYILYSDTEVSYCIYKVLRYGIELLYIQCAGSEESCMYCIMYLVLNRRELYILYNVLRY